MSFVDSRHLLSTLNFFTLDSRLFTLDFTLHSRQLLSTFRYSHSNRINSFEAYKFKELTLF